jgi:hypothetical protein
MRVTTTDQNRSGYTASQIARALCLKRQAVQRMLSKIESSCILEVNGNGAKAWSLSALPETFRALIVEEAKRRGFASPDEFLSARREWQPSTPIAQTSQPSLEKAAKLQRALRGWFDTRKFSIKSASERERDGLIDYQREFGHSISARHFRRLVQRVLDRDGGAENLERLELYLEDTAPKRTERAEQPELRALQEVIASFKNAASPTDPEIDYLWVRCFELFVELTEYGQNAKKLKSSLIRFLLRHAPGIGATKEAVRKSFERKLSRWTNGDCLPQAMADQRKEKSGRHRAPALSQDDRDTLIGHAVFNCDGRVSQAWRELVQGRKLSEGLLEYYLSNPGSKSYCPTRIREEVKFEVAMMDDIHHGPRQEKLNGAHISRDWSGVASMDWLCADDATLEVYFFVPDGKDWFRLTRGQFLVMIDTRTLRVLGFGMRPEKTYNAAMIRTLITRVCDEHGLPRKGFYFERGIWQSSRLLKGDPAATGPVSLPETELGLRSLGLQFRHSRLPRSKPVEMVIHALQDLMEGEPGYVGPDEKRERFERIQRKKLDVESRRISPEGIFYSLDQWVARLEKICESYNATVQDGKMTGGLSPDDAFHKFGRTSDPVIKLPASCRYLLANHRRPVKVTDNGITLRFGKQAYNYKSEETGRLRGQTVLAWFNPDVPEILTVTDTDLKNAFCVSQAPEVPAMDVSREQLRQAYSTIADHQSYARVQYRALRSKHPVQFRQALVERSVSELGNQMAASEKAARAEQSQHQKSRVAASKAYDRLRMTPPPGGLRPGQLEAAQRLAELLENDEEKPNQNE